MAFLCRGEADGLSLKQLVKGAGPTDCLLPKYNPEPQQGVSRLLTAAECGLLWPFGPMTGYE